MISFFKKIYSNLAFKEKQFFLIFLILFVVSFFILIFNFLNKSTINVPKNGGEIKIGIIGQPSNTNSVLAKNNPDKVLVNLLFSSLSKLSDKIEPIENNTAYWRVRLKEDIFWSNGKKITSDDVVFTISKIKEAEDKSPLFSFWRNIDVERFSELEVRFKLKENYSFFSEILNDFYIIPKHIFADLPVSNWNFSEYNLRPVSNGKYFLDKINILKNGFISDALLKINKYYIGDKPYIDQVNVRFYTNYENLIKAFNTGEIDAFTLTNFNLFNNINFKRPYNIYSFPILDYYAIFINQNQNLALKDLNVRKAMFMAINRSKLVKDVFNNYAIEVFNPLPWFNQNQESFNDEEIIKILDDNGWKLNNSGIREKKIKDSVIQLSFKLLVPDVEFLNKTADILVDDLFKIGIKIEIIKINPDELLEKNIVNRDYELILFGNAVYPKFNLYPFWHSSFIFHPGLNLSLYNNKKVDDLLINFYQRINIDQDKTINDVLEGIKNDYPAVFLYQPKYLLITSKNIYGIEEFLISNKEDIFKNINQWYLKTKRVFKK